MLQKPVYLYLCADQEVAYRHVLAEARKRDLLTPIPSITILTPSRSAEQYIHSILQNSINTNVQQFYGLAQSILRRTRSGIQEIKDIATRRLVRRVLIEMESEGLLTSFELIHFLPGFNQVIVAWLREMKSLGIEPERLLAHAETSANQRDKQLANLYNRYQQYLQEQSISDGDGLLWLAAEALEKNPAAYMQENDSLLFVFGFDQFTPIQLRILDALSACFQQTFITLSWDANRDETSLALTRFLQTRKEIQSTLQVVEELIPLDNALVESPRPQALRRLAQNLFESKSEPTPQQDHTTSLDLNSIEVVEAPSREAEVRAVLRSVKTLILDGSSPADIQILAPNPERYSKLMCAVATNYGIPVSLHKPLQDNPAIAALLELLSLHRLNFPRRLTLNTLRSPYFRQESLTAEEINLLEQLTIERPVIAGKEQWNAALQPVKLSALSTDSAPDDDEHVRLKIASSLEAEALTRIQEGLFAFFEQITPVSSATYESYALWIQEAIIGLWDDLDEEQAADEEEAAPLSLQMMACLSEQEEEYAERDLQATNILLRKIREIVVAASTIPFTSDSGTENIAEEAMTNWCEFERDLQEILPNTIIPFDPDLVAVQMDALGELRAITTEHLFVMGLSEGEFPTSPAPDVFYTVQERADSPLGLRQQQSAEDASLWWQVISNCKRTLFLSRPWLDDGGSEWPPSPYWDEVMACLTGLQEKVVRLKVSAPTEPADAASKAELFLALLQKQSQAFPVEFERHRAMTNRSSALLGQRQSWTPPGTFEGILRSPDITAELAARYGPSHVWSASRLNRFNNCPYGFFIEHILKINILEEPEEGLNARQRGSLLHAILEDLHNALFEKNIGLSRQHQEEILVALNACSRDVFKNAPHRFGFLPGPLWRFEQEELTRLVRALLRSECEAAGDEANYMPYKQELSFGIDKEGLPALKVASNDGRSWQMRGFIDRVDRNKDGRLRIIDYKSGSGTYGGPDIEKGLAFQTPLYFHVVERLDPDSGQPDESYYLHIPSRELSGKIQLSKKNGRDLIDKGIAKATWTVEQIRAGNFPNAPAKQDSRGSGCSSWCQLSSICQITRQSLSKGRMLLARGDVA